MSTPRSLLGAALILLGSCRETDPRREDAQWLLDAATKSQAAQTCGLEAVLSTKPEFAAIRKERFCDPHVVITAIRAVSANERLVEYDLVRAWNRAALEQWIAGATDLEKRLRTLRPERRLEQPGIGPPETRFVWTDPTDGQEFTIAVGGDLVHSADPPPMITATDGWRLIQLSKDFTIDAARRGRDTTEPLEAVLRRVGSGWEVAVPARAVSKRRK